MGIQMIIFATCIFEIILQKDKKREQVLFNANY